MFIIFSTVIFTLAAGCTDKEKKDGTSFEASVLENNAASLMVQPVEGSSELGSADKIVVFTGDAELVNAEGTKVTMDDIKVGSSVQIFYSGGIAESYPAQINGCYKVVLLD
ncbi:MAG TPA: DUF3221 domain-containing protein [Bacillota bacterium]|nr:DUF3221 domain-containing protein [Bacillota bacterium]